MPFEFPINPILLSEMGAASSSNNHKEWSRLKTQLNLAANRLKALQRKKTEIAAKERIEIANFLKGKRKFVPFFE
jgi:hypothetical protein